MPILKDLGIALAGTTAVSLAGIWVWRTVRRWHQKSPDEIERLRRLEVNACGRIAVGRIVELAPVVANGPAGPVLLYDYEVAGVTYEAAQDIGCCPDIAAAAPFLPGLTTHVKFDPKRPTNSILACETWCGIPDLDLPKSAHTDLPREPMEPPKTS